MFLGAEGLHKAPVESLLALAQVRLRSCWLWASAGCVPRIMLLMFLKPHKTTMPCRSAQEKDKGKGSSE